MPIGLKELVNWINLILIFVTQSGFFRFIQPIRKFQGLHLFTSSWKEKRKQTKTGIDFGIKRIVGPKLFTKELIYSTKTVSMEGKMGMKIDSAEKESTSIFFGEYSWALASLIICAPILLTADNKS